jgi:hypothetical protein
MCARVRARSEVRRITGHIHFRAGGGVALVFWAALRATMRRSMKQHLHHALVISIKTSKLTLFGRAGWVL